MEQAKEKQEKAAAMEEQRRATLVAILSPEARARREMRMTKHALLPV